MTRIPAVSYVCSCDIIPCTRASAQPSNYAKLLHGCGSTDGTQRGDDQPFLMTATGHQSATTMLQDRSLCNLHNPCKTQFQHSSQTSLLLVETQVICCSMQNCLCMQNSHALASRMNAVMQNCSVLWSKSLHSKTIKNQKDCMATSYENITLGFTTQPCCMLALMICTFYIIL